MSPKFFATSSAILASTLFLASITTHADEPAAPTTEPTAGGVIKVSDKESLAANMEKDVTVEGVCTEAAWSNSGKVMNLRFQNTEESRFGAVVFLKNREKIDKSFGGDAAKSWSGTKLRIKGKLSEYGGKAESMKGSLQIIINDPSQVTVVYLPTSQPAQ